MFCPECGEDNKDDATFCKKCGYSFKTNSKPEKETSEGKTSFWKDWSTRKKAGLIILVICVIGIILVAAIGLGTPDKNTQMKVSDLSISSKGYGGYDVSCTIVPDKDYNYLEMVVIFYDKDGAVIDKSPLVWNMNGITKDQTIKVSGSAYVSGSNTPVKADVLIFDKAFSNDDASKAVYKQTVNL